jgi:large subunit ribosomal protein L24
MKVKTGDTVVIIAGKNLGHKGKVLKALPAANRIVVEGANIVKRRQRPRQQGKKGEVVERPLPLAVSNAQIFCARCARGVRVGYKLSGEKKVRVCRSCAQEI